MIIIDETEVRVGTRMPSIEGETSPILEELTGADIMVSPLDGIPATTEILIKKHLQAGAELIQRKTGCDLASSVGTRMNVALARMNTYVHRPCQKVLMVVGTLTAGDAEAHDGVKFRREALFSGEPCEQPMTWLSIQSALDKWRHRGGSVVQLPDDDSLVVEWLQTEEKHLREYIDDPVKFVYPDDTLRETDTSSPLQELKLVKDWRKTLVSLPGIGPELAERIFADATTFSLAMMMLTDPILKCPIPGIGAGKMKAIREYLGLKPDELIVATQDNLPI